MPQVTTLHLGTSWGTPGFETETTAWEAAVIALNSADAPSTLMKGAVDTLIKALKNANVWTKFEDIWLFGNEQKESQCLRGLKGHLGAWGWNTIYRPFIQATGVSMYAGYVWFDSGINLAGSSLFTQNNNQTMLYLQNNTQASQACGVTTNSSLGWNGYIGGTDGSWWAYMNGSNKGNYNFVDDSNAAHSSGHCRGLWINNRITSGRSTYWRNGNIFIDDSSDTSTVTIPSLNMWTGSSNNNGAASGGAVYQEATQTLFSFGAGFTDAEIPTVYAAVQAYCVTMGIQVTVP